MGVYSFFSNIVHVNSEKGLKKKKKHLVKEYIIYFYITH